MLNKAESKLRLKSLRSVSINMKGDYGANAAATEYSSEKPRYIRITDVDSYGSLFPEKVAADNPEDWFKYKLHPGDILFARSGATAGKTYLHRDTNGWCIFAGYFIRFTPDQSQVDPKFLFYFTHSIQYQQWVESKKKGAAQPNINEKQFGDELHIPLPPIETQRKIAAVLDKARELIDLRKAQLEKLDEFLRSVFLDMFGNPVTNPKGWNSHSLRKISVKFSDGPFGSNLKTEHYANQGVRVIRLQNIGIGEFVDTAKAYISPTHYKNLTKHSCIAGDVIIATMGTPNIRACIVPEVLGTSINKADCIQCRPDLSAVKPEYICSILNLPETLSLANSMIHGQTRSRISMGQLATLIIPVPPLPLQTRFAAIVEATEAQKALMQQSLTEMENNFNSLMQQAFRGELF